MAHNLVKEVGEYIPKILIAGNEKEVLKENVLVKEGQKLERGTVIAKITASGKCVPVNSKNTDGSQNPYGILIKDIDTTDEALGATVYTSGIFNKDALKFGGEDTHEAHETELRKLGIILREVI